jgi:hypothetical protein
MQLWGTCHEAVLVWKVVAINLLLVASHPNLVWEKTWAYRFGDHRNDSQAKINHYARLSDWHVYAVKFKIDRFGFMIVVVYP